jgi:hypothetical protein
MADMLADRRGDSQNPAPPPQTAKLNDHTKTHMLSSVVHAPSTVHCSTGPFTAARFCRRMRSDTTAPFHQNFSRMTE